MHRSEASVLGRAVLQWGMQPEGTKMDTLRRDCPGSTEEPPAGILREERTAWSRAKEMLGGYRGNTTPHPPLPSWRLQGLEGHTSPSQDRRGSDI